MAADDSRALLDFPYVFSQERLLTPAEFGREAAVRSVHADFFLPALHEVGILLPLYRVSIDVRAAVRAARRDHAWRWETLHSWGRDREDLIRYRDTKRLYDPARARFDPWWRYERQWEDVPFKSSQFLYSTYQLTALPLIRTIIPRLRGKGSRDRLRWELDRPMTFELERARTLRMAAIVASSLEAYYLPAITEVLRLGHRGRGRSMTDGLLPLIRWRIARLSE